MFNKLILIIVLLSTSITLSNANEPIKTGKNQVKVKSMEYFNREEFNKNKNDNDEWEFVLKDGTIIKQSQDKMGYTEQVYPTSSPYVHGKAYNNNGVLIEKSSTFYGMIIGKVEYYDNNGKLIKSDNHDHLYKFTVDHLKEKMQEQFDVNIMDINQVSYMARYIDRSSQDTPIHPIYELGYRDKNNKKITHCLIIDGTTGDTLYTTKRFFRQKAPLVYDEYINSLK